MFYQYGILLVTIVSVTTALPSVDTRCTCQRIMDPVCGSDGTTYNNECLFNCARSVNTELTIKKYGRCGEQEEQECVCNYIYTPVCGTDGRTYGNECSLRCLKKKTPQLDVKHTGKCNTPKRMYDEETREEDVKETQVAEAPKDFVKVADPNTDSVAQEECFCTYNYSPVCGTDNRTYGNECSLRCLKNKTPQLDVKHTGKCNTPKRTYVKETREEDVKETRAESPKDFANPNTVNVAQSPEILNCNCPTKWKPVCGTNGVTYTNNCHLNCASNKNGGGVHVFRWGTCKSMTYGIQVRCSSCSLKNEPVCGVNGVTYANACLMRCVGVEMGWPGVCAVKQTQVHSVQPLQVHYYVAQPYYY